MVASAVTAKKQISARKGASKNLLTRKNKNEPKAPKPPLPQIVVQETSHHPLV